jgi:hypothetical protein
MLTLDFAASSKGAARVTSLTTFAHTASTSGQLDPSLAASESAAHAHR